MKKISVVVFCVSLSACSAPISLYAPEAVKGYRSDVTLITSEPSAANCRAGGHLGMLNEPAQLDFQTPAHLNVHVGSAGEELKIECSKAGYKAKTVVLKSHADGTNTLQYTGFIFIPAPNFSFGMKEHIILEKE